MVLTCKKEPTVVPPPISGLDTTSHNFTWTTYTIGGSGGSSYFKDVAIVSDTDIWAVGAIYASADTMYNAVHWDGTKWQLKDIPFIGSCSAVLYPPLQGIWVFGHNNILFTNGGSVVHFDGIKAEMDCGMNSLLLGAINKILAITPENIYVVGNGGTMVHYDGSTWTKQLSGTTIDLRDVWGSSNGSIVWASGYSDDNSQSVLLMYNGTQWKTIWTRQGGVTHPYGDLVTSVWGIKHLFTATNLGVYTQDITGIDTARQSLSIDHFPYRIRGSAENNVAVVGDFGMIWHYNQTDWKLLNETNLDQPFYSVAVSTTMIVAVGSDYTIFPSQALIYLGKRNSD